MVELDNSSRSFFRATYTPVDAARASKTFQPKKAVQKYALVANVNMDAEEVDRLKKYAAVDGPEIRNALSIIEVTVKDKLQTPLSERISYKE
jgi:hypothetical protein